MKLESLIRKRNIIVLYNKVMYKHRVEPIWYKQELATKIYNRVYKEDIKVKDLMNVVYSDIRLSELDKQIEIKKKIINYQTLGYSERTIARKLHTSRDIVRGEV